MDILTPNEAELAAFTNGNTDSVADIVKNARLLIARGCKAVIVTLGHRGSVIVDDQLADVVPAFDVDAVDTTAAGDVFNGVLAVQLANGVALIDAARRASAAAAISVTRKGAQSSIPKHQEVREFLDLHQSNTAL